MKYIVSYTITNNEKDKYIFDTYEQAKDMYIALAYNLTIKKARLYRIKENRKQLIEKFKKVRKITIL